MISSLLKKIFGSRNDRLLKQYRQTVQAINALEAGMAQLSDEDLRLKTTASSNVSGRGNRWMPCCPRRLPWCAKPGGVCWECAISMSS